MNFSGLLPFVRKGKSRGVFRTQPNTYDGAFLRKKLITSASFLIKIIENETLTEAVNCFR